ncbi:MAG: H-NS histone family protein [Gammaproteobacteria bacterium]|nr:H-NS histone family protein [Gammaproteobacteria bacterium]
MSEFISILTHARRLKAAVEVLTIEQLEEVHAKLGRIIEDKVAEVEAHKAANADRLAKIEELKSQLAAAGISPAELLGGAEVAVKGAKGGKGGKRAPRAAKYRYSENGEEKTWTGQGRMPSAMANAIANGASKDSFLI